MIQALLMAMVACVLARDGLLDLAGQLAEPEAGGLDEGVLGALAPRGVGRVGGVAPGGQRLAMA